MMKKYFHVDMDAFYAAVEQHDKPELQGKPVIIGASPGKRGVVSACSYEARRFGVHSAMPISRAYALCPHGIYLPVRMSRYQDVSRAIMALFSEFTPEVQQISVDEAFLNMTGTERLFGNTSEAARKLKLRVKEASGLTISVGAAPYKYLAKMASEYDKPDGLFIVAPGEETAFLDRLSLKDLWGVGKKTLYRLNELNIKSVRELRQYKKGELQGWLGEAGGTFLYKACRGEDPGTHSDQVKSRSISSETTFQQDTNHRETLENVLLDLAHQIFFRLLEENKRACTVFIKIRYSDFSTHTAQLTKPLPFASAEEILRTGKELLYQKWRSAEPIRLIGLGLSSISDAGVPVQQELFTKEADRQKDVEIAALELKKRGSRLTKASLLKHEES